MLGDRRLLLDVPLAVDLAVLRRCFDQYNCCHPLAQVDAVLGDRRPTLEDIRALGFTTRCLNESMRLYPQPPVLIRRALEDDIVGGYRVGALSTPCRKH